MPSCQTILIKSPLAPLNVRSSPEQYHIEAILAFERSEDRISSSALRRLVPFAPEYRQTAQHCPQFFRPREPGQ
jgi:hypothetical protein